MIQVKKLKPNYLSVKFIIFFVFYFNHILANSVLPFIQAQADEVSFNDNEVVLSRDVLIDHPLGEISASYIKLVQYGKTNPAWQFVNLEAKGKVKLVSKNGLTIQCDEMVIDQEKNIANFWGESPVSFVYAPINLRLNCYKVVVNLNENRYSSESQNLFSNALFKDEVKIAYGSEYKAAADMAQILPLLDRSLPSSSTASLVKSITLTGDVYFFLQKLSSDDKDKFSSMISCHELTYNLPAGEINFYGTKEKKLVVTDVQNSVSLYAEQGILYLDKDGKKNLIRALGRVDCQINSLEKNSSFSKFEEQYLNILKKTAKL